MEIIREKESEDSESQPTAKIVFVDLQRRIMYIKISRTDYHPEVIYWAVANKLESAHQYFKLTLQQKRPSKLSSLLPNFFELKLKIFEIFETEQHFYIVYYCNFSIELFEV